MTAASSSRLRRAGITAPAPGRGRRPNAGRPAGPARPGPAHPPLGQQPEELPLLTDAAHRQQVPAGTDRVRGLQQHPGNGHERATRAVGNFAQCTAHPQGRPGGLVAAPSRVAELRQLPRRECPGTDHPARSSATSGADHGPAGPPRVGRAYTVVVTASPSGRRGLPDQSTLLGAHPGAGAVQLSGGVVVEDLHPTAAAPARTSRPTLAAPGPGACAAPTAGRRPRTTSAPAGQGPRRPAQGVPAPDRHAAG